MNEIFSLADGGDSKSLSYFYSVCSANKSAAVGGRGNGME